MELQPRAEDDQGNAISVAESECKNESKHSNNNGVLVIKIVSQLTQIGKNNSVVLYDDKCKRQSTEGCNGKKLFEIDSLESEQKEKSISEETSEESSESAGDQNRIFKEKKKKRPKNKSDHHFETVVYRSLPRAQPSHSYFQLYKMSDDVMVQIQILRDNGRWDLFEDTAVALSHKYPSLEAQIVILLERGIAACYSNRFQEAKKLIKSGIEMAREIENGFALIGRGHFYLSALYRREKKTGKAITCVEIAAQNLSSNGIVTADTCSLTYERASALMDFVLQCAQPRPELLQRVMTNLRRSIDECLLLAEDDNFQGYVKTHHYALMKMAMLLLDCRTAAGRKRHVDCESIKEAEKYLTILKERYWDRTSRGEKVQYYFAQSDLHFRKKQYTEAREFSLNALEMAKLHGFNTEIDLALERLEDIDNQQQLSFKSIYNKSRDDKAQEPSSGNDADVSFSSDSDWLSKPSLL